MFARSLLVFFCAVFFVSSFSEAFGGDIKLRKSKDETSQDINLDFDVEKTSWDGGTIWIWGTVTNKSKRKYEYVKVTFSAWGGRGGELLNRTYTFTDPSDIGPGQVGYIIKFHIDCDIFPNLVEYKVTANP